MKRSLLVLFAFVTLPFAAAQPGGYLGIRLAGGTALDETAETLPFLGIQAGILFTSFELRLTADTFLFASAAHADVLYTQWFSSDVRGYVGGGFDTYSNVFVGESNPGVHATAGIEYRTGSVGLFVEGQPIYALNPSAVRGRVGLGINFLLF